MTKKTKQKTQMFLVPSIGKTFAIICLVFNIILPGTGTIMAGAIACLKPTLNPAKLVNPQKKFFF